MAPKRIQLKRTKGWRKPDGCVVVARPTKYGNPYKVGDPNPFTGEAMGRYEVVSFFRAAMTNPWGCFFEDLEPLRGKDLACWCPLDQPCHADVLLELANKDEVE